MAPLAEKATHSKSAIISARDVHTIFFQIHEILELNSSLLSRLDSRVSQWSYWRKIGDLFLEIVFGLVGLF